MPSQISDPLTRCGMSPFQSRKRPQAMPRWLQLLPRIKELKYYAILSNTSSLWMSISPESDLNQTTYFCHSLCVTRYFRAEIEPRRDKRETAGTKGSVGGLWAAAAGDLIPNRSYRQM